MSSPSISQSAATREPISRAATNSGPSAALDWRRIPNTTSALADSFMARARRLATDLNGFCRASRLDGVEAEIVSAMQDLRELRIAVRGMKAEAKADARRAS